MTLEHVNPGDKATASKINEIIDAINNILAEMITVKDSGFTQNDFTTDEANINDGDYDTYAYTTTNPAIAKYDLGEPKRIFAVDLKVATYYYNSFTSSYGRATLSDHYTLIRKKYRYIRCYATTINETGYRLYLQGSNDDTTWENIASSTANNDKLSLVRNELYEFVVYYI